MSDKTISLYVVEGDDKRFYTDPEAILAALAEAGVLEVARFYDYLRYEWRLQYVSKPWKEAK